MTNDAPKAQLTANPFDGAQDRLRERNDAKPYAALLRGNEEAYVMRRILHSDDLGWRLEIRKGTVDPVSETALSFRDKATALGFLRSHANERNLCTLRYLMAESLAAPTTHCWSNREVLEQVAWRLVNRQFSIIAVPVAYSLTGRGPGRSAGEDDVEETPAQAPPPPSQSPAASQETLPWITFQVVDDETEEPVAGVPLRLRLPDGTISEFTTDASGTIHIPEVQPGTCTIEDMLDSDALEVVKVI